MAISMGMMGSLGSSSSMAGRSRSGAIRCAASGSLMDQYQTLRIQPGASEKEVKKAFRQLALQYHPDVCKGRDCGVQFHRINEAYDIIINNLKAGEEEQEWQAPEWGVDTEGGYGDEDWDLWEEWMGWEGAGITDYSSHINPYI